MGDSTRRASLARAMRVLAAMLALGALYLHFRPRPSSLPLATSIDGPAPAAARGVLVYLHGLGGSLSSSQTFVQRLRQAGLPSDVAIVVMEGPRATAFGHSWGDDAEQQAESRARVRARLHELLGEGGPPPERVVIAGFSQGAGMAIDVAVEEPRIGALASFSPCYSHLRGELPKRGGLRILLAHGTRDPRCPVEESRSLARVLGTAQYVEFDGGHVVPAEAVRALVKLLPSSD